MRAVADQVAVQPGVGEPGGSVFFFRFTVLITVLVFSGFCD